MKFYYPIYKRITFAIFMNLKNNSYIFNSILDKENSKNKSNKNNFMYLTL